MKNIIRELIKENKSFSIVLFSGQKLAYNPKNFDMEKFDCAFVMNNFIYSYNAIEHLEINGPSILEVL